MACESALDAVTCEKELSGSAMGLALTQSCGGPPYPCQHYVVTTAGDSVVQWVTKDDLVQLLAPIDTPAEALLLAFDGTFMGYEVVCDAPDRASVRVADDGFEVVLTRLAADCNPIVIHRDLLHVSSEGIITVRRSNVASVDHGCV